MRITIKAVLMTVVCLLGLLLAVSDLSSLSQLGQANADLRTVYQDRVVPLRDLKIISDSYAVSIVDASHKARNGNLAWAQSLASVEKARGQINEHWRAYIGTYLDPNEAVLVNELKPLMTKVDAAVDRLVDVLKSGEPAALDDFVLHQLYQAVDPVTDRIGALIDLQVRVAGERFRDASDTYASARVTSWILLALAGATVLVGLFAVIRRVTRPIAALTAVMQRLAGGDYDTEVPGVAARDEVGDMARTVEVFKSNGLENQRMRAAQESERAAAEAAKRTALDRLATTVETEARKAVDQVNQRTRGMEEDARAMAASADAVGVNSQSVATAAEQALHNAETVASATEQLAASIREIGTQIAQASAITQRAVGDGAQARETIQSLSDAVARIGDVAQLIQNIASQTNLLALNATIEAARAGEAGKGFAVVASEVKNLANQTAKATEEIAGQITDIQSATGRAVTAVGTIAGGIAEVNHVAATIAAAMEEQAAATQEISRNVQEAASAAREVSRRISDVSREAGAAGERATGVRDGAGALFEGVEALRGTLVRVVRTAVPEVDRRRDPRYPVTLSARREEASNAPACRIVDLSVGGAAVEGWSDASVGAVTTLRIDGFEPALRARVVHSAGGRCHLRFDLAQDARAAFERRFDALVRDRAQIGSRKIGTDLTRSDRQTRG